MCETVERVVVEIGPKYVQASLVGALQVVSEPHYPKNTKKQKELTFHDKLLSLSISLEIMSKSTKFKQSHSDCAFS